MQTIRLATVKPTDEFAGAFQVQATDENGIVTIRKEYTTSANDARLYADFLCDEVPDCVCGYPPKVVKGTGSTVEPEVGEE